LYVPFQPECSSQTYIFSRPSFKYTLL
jgi:hypothetical protein